MSDSDPKYEDEIDETTASEGIPKEERKLQTQPYDKSVSDLVAMMNQDDIVLNPEYQRNYIWDNTRASRLVESILLNVPIPVIYVAEEDDGCWSVVDGLQRLHSLRRFFAGAFSLGGLEVLDDLDGCSYDTLNPKAQRILRNGSFRVIVIRKESHPEIKYDIFARLNQGAVRLNEQELRNCIYRGPFNDLLKELQNNPDFLQCVGRKRPQKRLYEAELILRCFAMSASFDPTTGKVTGYPNKMKVFLNDYMTENRHAAADVIQTHRVRFTETAQKTQTFFQGKAFRRYLSDDLQDTRLNRAIMDFVMVSFEHVDPKVLIDRHDDILDLYKNLPGSDDKFYDSILIGTSDQKRVTYRIETWWSQLQPLLG